MMRLRGLDALRGIAILLMVLDHLLIVFDVDHAWEPVRWTVTRAALPLFAIVSGSLVTSSIRWSRLGDVLAAALLVSVAGADEIIGSPDILFLLAASIATAAYLASRCSDLGLVVALCLCVIQPTTWPVPWTGYQPGTVLGLVLIGRLLGPYDLNGWACGLRSRVVECIGRWPLAWYVGHLLALFALKGIMG